MEDIITAIFDTPADILLVVAGIAFLGLAVVGRISGKIEPGRTGRVASGVVGTLLLAAGLILHVAGSPGATGGGEGSGTGAVTEGRDDPGSSASEDERRTDPEPDTARSSGGEDPEGSDVGSAGEEGFRVIETLLRADPFDHRGECPVTIEFSGRISAIGGAGTVTYRFIRSDGASAPVRTLEFGEPGSKDVRTTWRLGGEGFSYEGWQAIRILEPRETTSDRAEFTVECD